MTDALAPARVQLGRQVVHWATAASRLRDLESFAAPEAWAGLERYLSVTIRHNLFDAVDHLRDDAAMLLAALDAVRTDAELEQLRCRLVSFRTKYLRTETTLYLFADAINTRTNPYIASLLRACDVIAGQSMFQILDRTGKATPLVLTYLDKGLGAAILKAGLRLWNDTTENVVALIKIVPHNLYRPTALVHEAGHQVAHIVGWNLELAARLRERLAGAGATLAQLWASWASEIAADVIAFAHTGYAAVCGLHDVLAGEARAVFRYLPRDPHPISYLRVLLGVELCTLAYGPGAWDSLADGWVRAHPLSLAQPRVREAVAQSLPLLRAIAETCLCAPMRAFGGRPLAALVDPQRVHPEALNRLEQQIGPALYTSPHWVFTESLRLLALTGYRAAVSAGQVDDFVKQQEAWMLRLGASLKAA